MDPMDSSSTFEVPLVNGRSTQARFLDDDGTAWWLDRLRDRSELKIDKIGESRGGRPVYGLESGHGPVHVSVTAGAHADEPAGPVAACVLAWLFSEPDCEILRERFTFRICPQVNPDGAEANKAWFAPVPDVEDYLRNIKREGPGDDIEFGYPGDGKGPLRPENEAVAAFLKDNAPYKLHASLHSMGMADGAWFLIEKSWADRTQPLQHRLSDLATMHGFKLHDIQRNGEKGFTRIARGFCTTPTSVAMKEFFAGKQDMETADKFHLSSMEFVKSLGNNPLALVSEIPNFALGGAWNPGAPDLDKTREFGLESENLSNGNGPAPGETLYEITRDRIKSHVSAGDFAGAVEVARNAGVVPVPFANHVALQVEMVLAGCEYVVASDMPDFLKAVLSDDSSGGKQSD